MQPISYGSSQGYPMYPSSFDRLTTNGIITDDLWGYVTGQPSPYLQHYTAQMGGVPNLSYGPYSQVMPQARNNQVLPQGSIYNDIPRNIGPDTLIPKSKTDIKKIKQVATAILLGGLAIFGIIKGRNWIKSLSPKPTKPTNPPKTP